MARVFNRERQRALQTAAAVAGSLAQIRGNLTAYSMYMYSIELESFHWRNCTVEKAVYESYDRHFCMQWLYSLYGKCFLWIRAGQLLCASKSSKRVCQAGDFATEITRGQVGFPRRDPNTGMISNHHLASTDVTRERANVHSLKVRWQRFTKIPGL